MQSSGKPTSYMRPKLSLKIRQSNAVTIGGIWPQKNLRKWLRNAHWIDLKPLWCDIQYSTDTYENPFSWNFFFSSVATKVSSGISPSGSGDLLAEGDNFKTFNFRQNRTSSLCQEEKFKRFEHKLIFGKEEVVVGCQHLSTRDDWKILKRRLTESPVDLVSLRFLVPHI